LIETSLQRDRLIWPTNYTSVPLTGRCQWSSNAWRIS